MNPCCAWLQVRVGFSDGVTPGTRQGPGQSPRGPTNPTTARSAAARAGQDHLVPTRNPHPCFRPPDQPGEPARPPPARQQTAGIIAGQQGMIRVPPPTWFSRLNSQPDQYRQRTRFLAGGVWGSVPPARHGPAPLSIPASHMTSRGTAVRWWFFFPGRSKRIEGGTRACGDSIRPPSSRGARHHPAAA